MTLRRWVLVRTPLLAGLLALAAVLGRDTLRERLLAADNVHGVAKYLVEAWHAVLLHGPRDLLIAFLLAVAAGLLPLLGRARLPALAALLAGLGLLIGYLPTGLALLALVAANHLLRTLPRPLVHLPGVEVGLPLPTLAALGLADNAAVRALAALPLAAVFAGADAALGAIHYENAVADWPDWRTEGRVQILDRAPPGVRCDFHDVDVVPGAAGEPPRAVVVAETSLRLLSLPLPPLSATPSADPVPVASSWNLPPWWTPAEGLVMDSETDPATATTFFLDGPQTVTALGWTAAAGWGGKRTSPRLPRGYTHAYTARLAERGEIVLVSVNARSPGFHPTVTVLRESDLVVTRVGEPRDPQGRPLPTIRELAWIPALDRLALAPDFGDRLYLLDPATLRAEPWAQLPTMDGDLAWEPSLGRLVVADPSASSLWLVNPATGAIDGSIPTQPGVRSFAIDADRGLLLTASVVSGSVLVQRLDGSYVDRFGTFMPMIRTLALSPETGEAVLSTWTRLYRFRYADG